MKYAEARNKKNLRIEQSIANSVKVTVTNSQEHLIDLEETGFRTYIAGQSFQKKT